MPALTNGSRLGLTPEEMRERILRQRRESENRRRAKRRDEVLTQQRAWRDRNRDRYRAQQRESARKERERWPEKVAARKALFAALKYGRIQRGPCAMCGSEQQVQAHHEDYSRPLDVIWYCRQHHTEHHHG